MKKRILWAAADLAAAALIMLGVWVMDYLLPQKGIAAVPVGSSMADKEISRQTGMEKPEEKEALQKEQVIRNPWNWHEKFADKFTDTVISTDTSYTSPDISVRLSYHQYDTGKLDKSDSESIRRMEHRYPMCLQIFMWGTLPVSRRHLPRTPMVWAIQKS